MRHQKTAVVAATIAALVAAPTAAAADDGEPITTLAGGLDGPRQLNDFADGLYVVAEADSGEVSSVDPDSGESTTLLTIDGTPQGVDYDDGQLFVAVGEAEPGAGGVGSALLIADPDGTIVETIDLLAYELDNNPDGQPQFDEADQPFDALSNPFSVEADSERILVADAGANTVLSIDRDSHEISTFFVPPRVSPDEVPECADAQANPGIVGCDPVPTGVEGAEDGNIYVSTLGAEAPGASRVYVLSPDGDVLEVIEGLTSATGVAVDEDGTVYASELIEGAPEEEPPPADFDPATVGQIVRIDTDDTRTYAQVTMPLGLELQDGELFSTAWSVAAFVGLDARGEVVSVDQDAFTEAAAV
jgi:DNA-binding beta-propeller fold protein YncE